MEVEVKKTLMQKFTEFFASEKLPLKVVEKFEELLLVDGVTKITVEPSLEVGSAIGIYATDGTVIPAPIGEYELEDGRVIVVEMEGAIAMINDAIVDEELDAEGNAKETSTAGTDSAKVKELIERVETVSKYNEELKAKLDAQDKEIKFNKTENETLIVQFADLSKFVKESFDLLLKEPSKKPVQMAKNPLGETKTNSYLYKEKR